MTRTAVTTDRSAMTPIQMMGEKVFYRLPAGEDGEATLFLVALIVRVYSRDVVNLFVFSDGFLDLGELIPESRPIGDVAPRSVNVDSIVKGTIHHTWCWPEEAV